jgi:hypothetical protein
MPAESSSHLIAGVFILQEPKTVENRKLFSETTKHKHNKKWRFPLNFQPELKFFSWLSKK